jgi:D-tyrosyl-tRNA(Tyr) deacylase
MVYILAETLGRQVSAADKWDCERQMAGFGGPHWIL